MTKIIVPRIPIILFYHCLFYLDNPSEPLPIALKIVTDQMKAMNAVGLLNAASEMHVGVNGGVESGSLAYLCFPIDSEIEFHGLQCHNENLTIAMIEDWLKLHMEGEYYICYLHAKGCTHKADDPLRSRWRRCMMKHVVENWRECVKQLDAGCDAAGCHWMVPPETPQGQNIFAGNFWWAKASFLRTVPSIYDRDRIKQSGIGSIDSRYEAEVWLGNGPRLPKVYDGHPNWNPSKIGTCTP